MDGRTLREERQAKGLTVTALAKLSGVSRETIRLIEDGKAPGRPETQAAIRRALDGVASQQTTPQASPLAELEARVAALEDLMRQLLTEPATAAQPDRQPPVPRGLPLDSPARQVSRRR